MEQKSTFKRKSNKKGSMVQALTEAQKIAFAPFAFQTVAAMLDFGILKFLSEKSATKEDVMKHCRLSEYTVDTLFDASLCIGLVTLNEEGFYSLTKLADAFLYDEMTRVNFNFMKDVCYLGAAELKKSFEESRPAGLQKYFFDNAKTIYPMLTQMPPQMKKSWYEFDHHYSDDCFDEVLPIIFDASFKEEKPKNIFDLGGNTGKFEKACLDFDSDCVVTMFDLAPNIKAAEKNFDTKRCKFYPIDVLSEEKFPKISGAVFMSQFLDCFSKEQIVFILKKLCESIDSSTKVFILEPFIDKQKFEGAAYALSHISLYFTCMANGKSKMYKEKDMKELLEKAGLKLDYIHENIGKYDYTLLECSKK